MATEHRVLKAVVINSSEPPSFLARPKDVNFKKFFTLIDSVVELCTLLRWFRH